MVEDLLERNYTELIFKYSNKSPLSDNIFEIDKMINKYNLSKERQYKTNVILCFLSNMMLNNENLMNADSRVALVYKNKTLAGENIRTILDDTRFRGTIFQDIKKHRTNIMKLTPMMNFVNLAKVKKKKIYKVTVISEKSWLRRENYTDADLASNESIIDKMYDLLKEEYSTPNTEIPIYVNITTKSGTATYMSVYDGFIEIEKVPDITVSNMGVTPALRAVSVLDMLNKISPEKSIYRILDKEENFINLLALSMWAGMFTNGLTLRNVLDIYGKHIRPEIESNKAIIKHRNSYSIIYKDICINVEDPSVVKDILDDKRIKWTEVGNKENPDQLWLKHYGGMYSPKDGNWYNIVNNNLKRA